MDTHDRPHIPILAARTSAPMGGGQGWHTSAWQWSWLLKAPHRLGFFSGCCVLALTGFWWCAVMLAKTLSWPVTWAVAPAGAHACVMVLSFMPLFMVGFLFTAGPKWLGRPEVEARSLVAAVTAVVAGWLVALPGFHAAAELAAVGLALVTWGWAALVWRFLGLIRRSRSPDQLHARLVAAACVVGVLALSVATLALVTSFELLLRSAAQVALWGFVAPVFAVVSHRMLPFFTAAALPMLDAWRPNGLAWALATSLWLQALLVLADLWIWPQPDAMYALRALWEATMAALLLALSVRWGLIHSLRIRLLAMLHAAFLWLGIAFALGATAHVLQAITHGQQTLGLAPTHALAMGYLGGSLLAMATRVSIGHSGRPLEADNPLWLIYGLLHLAALARVGAALWSAAEPDLVITAAGLWAAVALAWALRYGNWYGRIRKDGKPG